MLTLLLHDTNTEKSVDDNYCWQMYFTNFVEQPSCGQWYVRLLLLLHTLVDLMPCRAALVAVPMP